ncbi:MAG: ferritin [Planctomycetota bacterium]
MMKPAINDAFNDQLNKEYYSSYLYLAMSAFLDRKGLKGMAALMKRNADEEVFHAEKILGFIQARGGTVRLAAIDAPPVDWDSVHAAADGALEHERKITASIDALVDTCRKESDHAGESFLQWFVNEQVEEEETAQELVDQVALTGESGPALFMLDRDLAASVPADGGAAAE